MLETILINTIAVLGVLFSIGFVIYLIMLGKGMRQ